jgi:class 3 adenylate cyclase
MLTAVTMQQEFNQLRQEWFDQSGSELGLGIGLDMGDVVMGNVGAESRMSFRMVGEPMNTAHRLVDLAEDGQIIISQLVNQSLKEQAVELVESINLEEFGPVKLKGISPPQIIYRTRIERPELVRTS